MSESENERKGREVKMCRLAKASLILSIIWCILYFFCILPMPAFAFTLQDVLLHFAFAPIPSVLAILALLRIKISKQKLAGYKRAVFALILNFFVIFVPVVDSYLDKARLERRCQVLSSANLKHIGVMVLLYSGDFDGKYPTSDKWCDLLVENYRVDTKIFICRSALGKGDKGRCHYALNPDCEPNSPPDMVLLFETKGGWNQFGGPEILTTENHNGKGCNVLFNDGRVEFVKKEQIGKLKWKSVDSGGL